EEDPGLVRKAEEMADSRRKSKMAQFTDDVLAKGKELLPEDEGPLFSKNVEKIDPKVAIIEDMGPKWEGYGPNGEDYFKVATPTPSGSTGELAYSHGMLTPETEAALQEAGIKLVKRSEMQNEGVDLSKPEFSKD